MLKGVGGVSGRCARTASRWKCVPNNGDEVVAGELVLVLALELVGDDDKGDFVGSKRTKVGVWLAVVITLYGWSEHSYSPGFLCVAYTNLAGMVDSVTVNVHVGDKCICSSL